MTLREKLTAAITITVLSLCAVKIVVAVSSQPEEQPHIYRDEFGHKK